VDRVGAAHQRASAAGQRVVEVAADHVELAGHGDRPEIGVRLRPGAQRPGPLDHLLDEAVVDGRDRVDALDADAGLAGVGDRAPDRRPRGRVEVGVAVDEHRVLAAELEHHRGEALGAGRHHLPPGRGRTGEGDLVDAGTAERFAGRAEPGHHLEDRLLGDHLGEALLEPAPDRRGVLAGLEHHRVAGRQRVADRAERGEHGIVPRADHADHPERLVLDPGAEVARQQRRRDPLAPKGPARPPGGPVEVLGHQQHLDERVVARLAVLAVDQVAQLVGAPRQQPLEGQQACAAPIETETRPPCPGLAGAFDRGRDLVGPVDREAADQLAGRRAQGVERGPRGGCLCGGSCPVPSDRHWSRLSSGRAKRPRHRGHPERPRQGCPTAAL
jgi:hypothetical protein